MKSNIDKLDVDKLVPVPVDLNKLSSYILKNNVVKRDVGNTKFRNIKDKILDITNLANNTTLNAKINKVVNLFFLCYLSEYITEYIQVIFETFKVFTNNYLYF